MTDNQAYDPLDLDTPADDAADYLANITGQLPSPDPVDVRITNTSPARRTSSTWSVEVVTLNTGDQYRIAAHPARKTINLIGDPFVGGVIVTAPRPFSNLAQPESQGWTHIPPLSFTLTTPGEIWVAPHGSTAQPLRITVLQEFWDVDTNE